MQTHKHSCQESVQGNASLRQKEHFSATQNMVQHQHTSLVYTPQSSAHYLYLCAKKKHQFLLTSTSFAHLELLKLNMSTSQFPEQHLIPSSLSFISRPAKNIFLFTCYMLIETLHRFVDSLGLTALDAKGKKWMLREKLKDLPPSL